MTLFFEFQLKVGGVLALGVLIYLLFLSRDTYFNRNRVWLLCCLFVPWIVPLIAMPFQIKEFLFGKETPVNEFVVTDYATEPISPSMLESNFINRETVLLLVFVLITLLLLIRLAMGCFSVLKLRNSSIKSHYKGLGLRLFKNVSIIPFSFFRTIYAPEEIEHQENCQLILDHELTHCRQLHSIDIVLAELVILLQWWNPFAWWLRKLIAQNHEYCVDSSMLKKVQEPSKYKYLLVHLLSSNVSLQLVNSFNGSFTKKRIVMMNKNNTNHILSKLKIIPVLVLLLLAVSAFTNADKTVVPTIYETIGIPASMEETMKDSMDTKKAIFLEFELEQDVVHETEKEIEKEVLIVAYTATDSATVVKEGKLKLHEAPNVKILEKEASPLIIIDGNESSVQVLNDLDTKEIEKIIVIKDKQATDTNEDKGKNGVIQVISKNGSSEEVTIMVHDSIKTKVNKKVKMKFSSSSKYKENPLVIVNGKESSLEELSELDHKIIKSIDVNKSEDAVLQYGDKAKNGVIHVFLLNEEASGDTLKDDNPKFEVKVDKAGKKVKKHKFIFDTGNSVPIVYVDGEKVSMEDFESLDAENIESVHVLKDATATSKYGSKAKNGVIEVTLKK